MTGYAKDILTLTVRQLPISDMTTVNVRNPDSCKTYYKGYADEIPANVGGLRVLSITAIDGHITIFAFGDYDWICF